MARKCYRYRDKLKWWTDSPYNDIEILKHTKEEEKEFGKGYVVFVNNRAIHKKPFKTKNQAIKKAGSYVRNRWRCKPEILSRPKRRK